MKTNFEKIREFHQVTGLPDYNNGGYPNFLDDEKLCNFRLSLIDEEVNELRKALKEKNKKEVVDALSDILYVVYGAGSSMGVDLDNAFDCVHKSNMSKLCKTEEEAKRSVEWYKMTKADRYSSPSYRNITMGDKKWWIVYNEETGKILKSIEWKEPEFNL